MRIFSTIMLCMLATSTYSQKIKVEYDKFEKAKRIETGWIQVKPTMSAPLAVKFRSVGDSAIFITLAGANVGANVIGLSSTVKFLFDDETTCEGSSTGIQDYDIGQYGKSFKHQYRISRDQLEKLSKTEVKAIRKYDTDTYTDFEIAKKNRDKLTEVAQKVLKELDSH